MIQLRNLFDFVPTAQKPIARKQNLSQKKLKDLADGWKCQRISLVIDKRPSSSRCNNDRGFVESLGYPTTHHYLSSSEHYLLFLPGLHYCFYQEHTQGYIRGARDNSKVFLWEPFLNQDEDFIRGNEFYIDAVNNYSKNSFKKCTPSLKL